MTTTNTDRKPCDGSGDFFRPQSLSARFRSISGNESGVTAIEYALLASLIAVAIVASVSLVGGALVQLWSNVADLVSSAGAG